MATAGRANTWAVSMRSSHGGAMASRPFSSCAFLHRAPPGLSLVAWPSVKFISSLSSPCCRTPLNVIAIHAQEPDFYKIPYVEGIPVGKRLKIWNLPPSCKHSELLEWFGGVDVKVESLEFTDDPVLNAQGIGGFVELATKQDACIAIVRLDGYKFRGHYIRMDFAEKRLHSRDYGSRRSRPKRSSKSSGSPVSFATPSRPSMIDMVPTYSDSTSANAQSNPSYEATNPSTVQASHGYGSNTQSANAHLTPRHMPTNFTTGQASSDYGRSTQSLHSYLNGSRKSEGIQINPSDGNVEFPSGSSSALPSAGYGGTQISPGHAPIPPVSVGSLSSSDALLSSNIQSAPRDSITAHTGDIVNKTMGNHPRPSGYGNPQYPYGSSPVLGSSLQQNSGSGVASPQRPPSYNCTELDGQFATVPSGSSDNMSQDPLCGNRSMKPLYSDGTVTGKSFKSGSGQATYNNPKGAANFDNLPASPYSSQSLTSSYSSQPSSSASVLNNQSDSAFGKTIPPSYEHSSHQQASSVSNGISYGSIKDGNSVLPIYGENNPPSVQSSPNRDAQSFSSYDNTTMQSNTSSIQSSVSSLQVPSDTSSTKSSPSSLSIPTQAGYGEGLPSTTSSTTQSALSSYDGAKKSAIGTVSSSGPNSSHRPVAQGPPRSFNSSYVKEEPCEDPLKNYGVPDAAVVEPWLHRSSFRSGPMFGSPQPSSLNRLFLGNLDVLTDEATLHEICSKFGTVLETRVLRDKESGRSRGFAVVAMSNVDEMKAASKALDGWRVKSRPLKVDAVTFEL